MKVILLGGGLLIALMGWSWLRAQRNPWIRRRRGVVGWTLAIALMVLLAFALKALLP